jgi:GntR family transcriptional regulator
LTGFTEDMTDELRTVETAIRVKEVITADAEVSGQLGLPPEAEVIYLSRLRTVDGSPSALQDSWIPFGLCPSLARVDLVDDSLYKTLEQSCGVVFAYADQTIRAVAAGPGEAAALEVGTGSPLLKTERITRNDRDTPIELAHSWTRPEFELVTRLER